jgi:hypothetical protein
MLQEQQGRQFAAMTATNNANMDAMMERMNTLMTGGGGICPAHQDKERTPTVRSSLPTSTGSGTNQPKNPRCASAYVPIATDLSSTNPKSVSN